MKDVDFPYSIFFSPDNILPLNHILCLPDINFNPWPQVKAFSHMFSWSYSDHFAHIHKKINHINIYNSGCEMSLKHNVYP